MDAGPPIPAEVIEERHRYFAGRRTFDRADFQALLDLIATGREAMPIAELVQRPKDMWDGLVGLRHDVDHDLVNAVRMARLEHEYGVRSTYYVLHTDWYYRHGPRDRPASFLLNAIEEIASLGHEIALHNNAITAGLQLGEDPCLVLERELSYLRDAGFQVLGTVAHGDPLCRQAGYVNSEVFVECPRPALGAPDRVVRDPADLSRAIRLQPRLMADFGLTHEAGFIGHTTYCSDTGGRWAWTLEEVCECFAKTPGALQILTHPIWWAFEHEPVRPRPPRSLE